MYKQKVKHLLYQHQNNVTELKGDGTAALKAQMGEQKLEENKLQEHIWNLKTQTREGELSHEEVRTYSYTVLYTFHSVARLSVTRSENKTSR